MNIIVLGGSGFIGRHTVSALVAAGHRVGALQRGDGVSFPGDGSDWLQLVDVRDVARFIVTVIEHDLGGAYNLAGHRMRWHDFVAALGVARPRWAPVAHPDFRTTPLYRPAGTRHAALMDVSSARAQAVGFQPRPAAAVVRACGAPAITG